MSSRPYATANVCGGYLDGTGILEQSGQVTLLCLQIRVSANVLLGNEDVGYGGLARHFAEGALDR